MASANACFAEWRRDNWMTVPIAKIVEALAEDSTLLRLPSCLDDASRYLKSKPAAGILRPIDGKRLRALRHIAARKARCKSLPKIAANLAMLAYAEATIRSNDVAL